MTATDNDGNELAKMVGQYLQMRHNMGYKLRRHRELLMDFVKYLDATGAAHLTSKIAVDWASLPADGAPRWWHLRLGVVTAKNP
jgi:integrase/recombinase XerD